MTTKTKKTTAKTEATMKPAKTFPPHPLLPPMPAEAAKPGKGETILALIQRRCGATDKELERATGWEAHSVRRFISIANKKGLAKIVSAKLEDGQRVYRAQAYGFMAMTYQQVIWAINDAAILAAESAFDAFGNDPAAEIPSPEVAWEFLNEQVYEDGGIERPAAPPRSLRASSSRTTAVTFARW